MIKIYSDAAFDRFSGLGCYCLVIVIDEPDGTISYKDYSVEDIDNCKNSTEAELYGLRAAVSIASRTNKEVMIYCDSMGALDHVKGNLPALVHVRHFKGHQLEDGAIIDDDVKRHHWADTMARYQLRARLDVRKTEAYNKSEKES